jgi:hypothetical protein
MPSLTDSGTGDHRLCLRLLSQSVPQFLPGMRLISLEKMIRTQQYAHRKQLSTHDTTVVVSRSPVVLMLCGIQYGTHNSQSEQILEALEEVGNDLDRVFMLLSEFPLFTASTSRDGVGGSEQKRKAHP